MSSIHISFTIDLQSFILKVALIACSIVLARYISTVFPEFTATKRTKDEKVTTSITAGSVQESSGSSRSDGVAGTPVEKRADSSLHEFLPFALPSHLDVLKKTGDISAPTTDFAICTYPYNATHLAPPPSAMPPKPRLPSPARFEDDTTHAAAYASFMSDNSLSLLTEDQSSILDDTLPSILEEAEIVSDGGYGDGDVFGVGYGDGDGDGGAHAAQTSTGTQKLTGLGFKGLSFPSGLVSSRNGLPRAPTGDVEDDRPSAQFIAHIVEAFTSTPSRN